MSGFKELKVWQISIDLVMHVYKATADFPKDETYGLVSQMRRCAVSIPSNIAEGSSRNGAKEFTHFLYIAHGSLSELDTQLIISKQLGYINDTVIFENMMKQIRSMIAGLISSQQTKTNPTNKI